MLNVKNLFLAIFLMFSSFASVTYAIDDKEFENASDCGMENNVVKFFSWDICEQDFAFRIFYKLYPDVFDEQVLPIVNATYLDKVKDLEVDNIEINRAYQHSMLKITEIMLWLSMLFATYLFAWHAALALLRTSTEGSFLGKQYNATKTGVKYGIIIFLLLPVGNGLVVVHWFVFVTILFSIAIANLFYGIFLNFIDAGSDTANLSGSTSGVYEDSDEDRTTALNNYIKKNSQDHNFYYATEITKKLSKAAVCKLRTEQFIVESNIFKINSSNEDKYYSCSGESIVQSQILGNTNGGNGFVGERAFSSYKLVDNNLESNGNKVNISSGISFGKQMQGTSCLNIDGIDAYSCGSLNYSVPNINDDDLVETLNEIGFFSTYASVSSSLQSSFGMDAASVESAAMTGWETISSKLTDKLAVSINGKKQLTPSDETRIKNVAYVYHQLLMNDAMVGNATTSGNGLISPTGNSPLSDKFTKIAEAAALILDISCIRNQEGIKKSKNFIKYVSNYDSSNAKDISGSCVVFTRSKPTDIYGIEYGNDESNVKAAVLAANEKGEKAQDLLVEVVDDIKNKREGIELSMFKSLKSVSKLSLTAQMRKIGFASAGGFMLKIIKDKDIDNKFMRSLQNSISFNDGDIDNKFIGKTVNADKSNTANSLNNANFGDIAESYDTVTGIFTSDRKDLRMTDISPIVSGIYDESLADASRKDTYAASILQYVTDPLGGFKHAIGIRNTNDTYKDIVEKCMKNIKECPIPLENPIKGISDFGHNLVAGSANLIATSIGLTFTRYLKEKYMTSQLLKNKGGDISNADAINKITKDMGKNKGSKLSFLKAVGSLFNAVEFVLASLIDVIMLTLTIGIFLAYIIPLIPFMMFTFAFLSWITICLLTLFIAPMWVVFNLKMTESSNGNSEMYRSGYNIILQVLLRPSLLVIALVLGWSIFILAFLVLNLTIVPFIFTVLMTDGGSFSILGLIHGLIIILTYGILVYIIIKFVFNFMYEITNKLFEALNVTAIDDKSNIAENISRNAVMASIIGFRAAKDVNKEFSKGVKKESAMREQKASEAERNDEVELIVKEKIAGRSADRKPDHEE